MLLSGSDYLIEFLSEDPTAVEQAELRISEEHRAILETIAVLWEGIQTAVGNMNSFERGKLLGRIYGDGSGQRHCGTRSHRSPGAPHECRARRASLVQGRILRTVSLGTANTHRQTTRTPIEDTKPQQLQLAPTPQAHFL